MTPFVISPDQQVFIKVYPLADIRIPGHKYRLYSLYKIITRLFFYDKVS